MAEHGITTILSDVGGVLIRDFDTANTIQQHVGLDDDTFKRVWPGLVYRFGSGAINEQSVWRTLERNGGLHIENDDIFVKSFEDRLKIYQDVMHLMEKLGQSGYRLAILSNTIEPHTKVLRNTGVYDKELFTDGIFLSHEIKMRKPEPVIYEYALSQLSVENPANVLFIDKTEANLLPAQQVGMQTLHAGKTQAEIVASLQFLLND